MVTRQSIPGLSPALLLLQKKPGGQHDADSNSSHKRAPTCTPHTCAIRMSCMAASCSKSPSTSSTRMGMCLMSAKCTLYKIEKVKNKGYPGLGARWHCLKRIEQRSPPNTPIFMGLEELDVTAALCHPHQDSLGAPFQQPALVLRVELLQVQQLHAPLLHPRPPPQPLQAPLQGEHSSGT